VGALPCAEDIVERRLHDPNVPDAPGRGVQLDHGVARAGEEAYKAEVDDCVDRRATRAPGLRALYY
jgi:hypothetical protein